MFDPNDSLNRLLIIVCRLHHNRLRKVLGSTGLHPGQPRVIIELGRKDGLSHSELGERLDVSPSTISNMVKRMERAGFLERRRDDVDERVSRVYLTDAGRGVQAVLMDAQAEMEELASAGLTGAERNELRRLLMLVKDNLEKPLAEPDGAAEPTASAKG